MDAPQRNLPRGSACSACRQRKQRCDGAMPYCTPCSRLKTQDRCIYGSGERSMNYIVGKIGKLEKQVEILSSRASSPSQMTSPRAVDLGTESQPFLTQGEDPAWKVGPQLIQFFAASGWQPLITRTPGLLALFAQAAHHDPSKLFKVTGVHEALQNAIYLWGAERSSSLNAPFEAYRQIFLRRCLRSISEGMHSIEHDTILDVLQATVLIALFFLYRCKDTEATYHVSAAVSLVMSMEMHQLSLPGSGERSPLGRVRSAEDLTVRVSLFWDVYLIDKLWSLVFDRPPNLLDSNDTTKRITTPWPTSQNTYKQNNSKESSVSAAAFQTMLSPQIDIPGTLRLKSAFLAAMASRGSKLWIGVVEGRTTILNSAAYDNLTRMMMQFATGLPSSSNHPSGFDEFIASAQVLICIGNLCIHHPISGLEVRARSLCLQSCRVIHKCLRTLQNRRQQEVRDDVVLFISLKISQQLVSRFLSILKLYGANFAQETAEVDEILRDLA